MKNWIKVQMNLLILHTLHSINQVGILMQLHNKHVSVYIGRASNLRQLNYYRMVREVSPLLQWWRQTQSRTSRGGEAPRNYIIKYSLRGGEAHRCYHTEDKNSKQRSTEIHYLDKNIYQWRLYNYASNTSYQRYDI